MKHLLRHWDKLSTRIQNSPHIFLFLDYDGTLTPIVSRPEEAILSPAIKGSIRKLHKKPGFTVAVISGRSLKDIKKMVGLKGLIYAGNHGLEIEKKGRAILRSGVISKRSLLNRIALALKDGLRCIKGARVEDKGLSLSVHFRLVARKDIFLLKRVFRKAVRPYLASDRIRVSSGKKVLEVRPGVAWDKGKAVLHILPKGKKTLPVYIGDDVTDRDAFRALKGRGISIFVGSNKKGIRADYFLKNTKEVGIFLERLVAL